MVEEGQRSETELRKSTGTHKLEGISWQKVRDQRRAEEKHRDSLPGLHGRRSEIKDKAEEKHSDTQPRRDFMVEGQRSETELRKNTGTHMLKGISWWKVRDQR